MNFQQIVKMLKECNIQGGVWIDAGCGNGTFTFPLATLVSKVIALDKNNGNLSYLESKKSPGSNIKTQEFDFSKPFWYEHLVDGILFGFSLHYDPVHATALGNAYCQLKKNGKLVVIDYSSKEAVPWVPYPIPPKKLILILKALSFTSIQVIQTFPPRKRGFQWNNTSYVLTALK